MARAHQDVTSALLLCYTGGKPSLVLVDPYTGATKPFASPADRADIAIDAAHRCGDGVILDPHGDYYGLSADLSGAMVDLGRHRRAWSAVTRSGLWRPLDPDHFELVTWSGEQVRTQPVPVGWSIIGEAQGGVVISDRAVASGRAAEDAFVLVDRRGVVRTLPGVGKVCAVSGRHVVRISDRVDLAVVDLADSSVRNVARPEGITSWWELDVPVDPAGRHVALTGSVAPTADDEAEYRRPSVLCVVDLATGDLRSGERIRGPQNAVWSTSGDTLFVGDVYNDRLHIVDPLTMQYRTSPVGRRGSFPLVDTGDLAPPLGSAPTRMWPAGDTTGRIPRTRSEADADLEERLADVPSPDVRSRLRAKARTSVRLVRAETQSKRTGTGHTRVGGRPDLPKGERWPSAGGASLAFIGQIDLAVISFAVPSSLPPAGLLLLFFGPYLEGDYPAREEWKVIHAPPGSVLTKRAWPRGLPQAGRFTEVFLEPAIEITIPSGEEVWSEDEWAEVAPAMQSRVTGPVHRVLGHPDLVQGYEIGELLVQFDSDAESGFSWGDSGMLYFTVDDVDRMDDFGSVRAHAEST